MTGLLWPVVAVPVPVAFGICLILRLRPDASVGDAAGALAVVIRALLRMKDDDPSNPQ